MKDFYRSKRREQRSFPFRPPTSMPMTQVGFFTEGNEGNEEECEDSFVPTSFPSFASVESSLIGSLQVKSFVKLRPRVSFRGCMKDFYRSKRREQRSFPFRPP